MDKYHVNFTSRALRDLDDIYMYISHALQVPETALKLVTQIEEKILSLEEMPYRCAERKTGMYTNQGYRQLFVGNYTVIYRIDETSRKVIIITVRYTASQF